MLKGVGKVYVQVVVDVFCSLAFAKVYTSKMPMTACDVLYDRVLPFYEALGVSIGAVLTDNGRQFCGRSETHPYELLLGTEGIEHRTTRVHMPRTNRFVERMNRTLLDECFRVAGRTTWYLERADIQRDLDIFLKDYNLAAATMATASAAGRRRRPCARRWRSTATCRRSPEASSWRRERSDRTGRGIGDQGAGCREITAPVQMRP
jgi:transposase InsO family protein